MSKNQKKPFEVMSSGEMQEKYGLYAHNAPQIRLDPNQVPKHLHALIPFAESWGIGDDIMRDDYVLNSLKKERDELKDIIESHRSLIDEWLQGPESFRLPPTDAYVAFTCMIMALDLLDVYTEAP